MRPQVTFYEFISTSHEEKGSKLNLIRAGRGAGSRRFTHPGMIH